MVGVVKLLPSETTHHGLHASVLFGMGEGGVKGVHLAMQECVAKNVLLVSMVTAATSVWRATEEVVVNQSQCPPMFET